MVSVAVETGEGGAHAFKLWVLLDGGGQHGVGLKNAFFERVDCLFDVFILRIRQSDSLRGDCRGNVSSSVTTHSIGNKEELIARVTGILVSCAVLANVAGCVANGFYCQVLGPQLKVCGSDSNGHSGSNGLWCGDLLALKERAVG